MTAERGRSRVSGGQHGTAGRPSRCHSGIWGEASWRDGFDGGKRHARREVQSGRPTGPPPQPWPPGCQVRGCRLPGLVRRMHTIAYKSCWSQSDRRLDRGTCHLPGNSAPCCLCLCLCLKRERRPSPPPGSRHRHRHRHRHRSSTSSRPDVHNLRHVRVPWHDHCSVHASTFVGGTPTDETPNRYRAVLDQPCPLPCMPSTNEPPRPIAPSVHKAEPPFHRGSDGLPGSLAVQLYQEHGPCH